MVSGKYSALAGAIAREQSIATVANNLANINTSGYKKSGINFESMLQAEKQIKETKGINYSRSKENFTDFTPGAIRPTENPLDAALNGNGFFKVQGAESVLYTRRGDFVINADGLLTTASGLPVLDEGNGQITIPDTDTSDVVFAADGTIYLLGPRGSRSEVSKIAMVEFENRNQLKRETDTTFSNPVGAAEIPSDTTTLVQGSLELSNVNMAEEMAKMVNNNRAYETMHKVLESYSALGEQLEELGTLG